MDEPRTIVDPRSWDRPVALPPKARHRRLYVCILIAAVDVARISSFRGDPGDPDTLAKLQTDIAGHYAKVIPSAADVSATHVHGFPAARVRVEVDRRGRQLTVISTIIQAGDRAFQVTVTSRSGARAVELSRRIVPTFAPR